ncbi:MAG: adenine deaminase C-terminal domain-containing protein, partial [Spirochaetota bacterium]
EKLGVNKELDPFMTLSFLALPVIPELKLTDMGLFDTRSFTFTEVSVK